MRLEGGDQGVPPPPPRANHPTPGDALTTRAAWDVLEAKQQTHTHSLTHQGPGYIGKRKWCVHTNKMASVCPKLWFKASPKGAQIK